MDAATLNKVLLYAAASGASDVHLRAGDVPSLRLHGALKPLKADKLTAAHTRQALEVILGARGMTPPGGLDAVQDLDTSYEAGAGIRYRVHAYKERGRFGLVLRIIPAEPPQLEGLGLPPILKQLATLERGLVLVAGSTGSGKSTTLAALVDHINRTQSAHIVTIEDPIEFIHKNNRSSISQREVGVDTPSFASALRSSLRQDPDIIMVGEMRDLETMDIALKAAETGHVVLSTVHTTDVVKTVSRLLSFFPGDVQAGVRARLADSLQAILCQRLLPKDPGPGLVLAMEVLVHTKTVAEYIMDPARTSQLPDVIAKGRDTYGMQTFDQHLIELYKQKVISLAAARSGATNSGDFERALNFE